MELIRLENVKKIYKTGEVITKAVDGKDISKWNKKQLTGYRRDDIGFVFQFYNLVPNLTATENVELALQISKDPLDAEEVLKDVGLGHRLNNFPAQLSEREPNLSRLGKLPPL